MNRDPIRCINKKKNHVAEFPRFMCEDRCWQSATGYMPEPLPEMNMGVLQLACQDTSQETSPALTLRRKHRKKIPNGI